MEQDRWYVTVKLQKFDVPWIWLHWIFVQFWSHLIIIIIISHKLVCAINLLDLVCYFSTMCARRWLWSLPSYGHTDTQISSLTIWMVGVVTTLRFTALIKSSKSHIITWILRLRNGPFSVKSKRYLLTVRSQTKQHMRREQINGMARPNEGDEWRQKHWEQGAHSPLQDSYNMCSFARAMQSFLSAYIAANLCKRKTFPIMFIVAFTFRWLHHWNCVCLLISFTWHLFASSCIANTCAHSHTAHLVRSEPLSAFAT